MGKDRCCSGISSIFKPEGIGKCFINEAFIYQKERLEPMEGSYPGLAIFVIHGTWAGQGEKRVDNNAFIQNIKQFAKRFADRERQPAIVTVLSWSGSNSSEERIDAGNQLAKIITEHFWRSDFLITVGHSHGGNVALAASNSAAINRRKINMMINFATPIREVAEEAFEPKRVDRLFSFYSTGDIVQTAGGTYETAAQEQSARKYTPKKGVDIKNIRVLIGGNDPLHSGQEQIKSVSVYMYDIVQTIFERYKINDDLCMNIAKNVVQNPFQIAIRQHITDEQIVLNDELMRNKDELYRFMQQLKNELLYSNLQSGIFKQEYGHDINDKAWLMVRTVKGIVGEAWGKMKMPGFLSRAAAPRPGEQEGEGKEEEE